MKNRIIFNCIFVTALLGSHAVFANPNVGEQEQTLQKAAEYVASSIGRIEVQAVTTNLLNMLDYESHAEVVQRIIMESRQELSRQLNVSNLVLEALKFSDNYSVPSTSNTDGLGLTAR